VATKFIQAAGGIVVRNSKRPLVAVVQRAKDGAWVLPRGKLKRDESAKACAGREVVEETGHRITVNEFLGAMTYRAGGKAKVVQFWQMQAEDDPSHELMPDIITVEWLPLKAAVRRLSYPLEKLFLRSVGPRALQRRDTRKLPPGRAAPTKTKTKAGKKADKNIETKAGDKPGKKSGKKSAAKDKAKSSKPAKSDKSKKPNKPSKTKKSNKADKSEKQ
jgi:8-oxo-dGTP diphosphatase